MPEEKNNTVNAGQKELVLTRRLQAPRTLVWKAWTEPERLAQWWGPKGMPITVHKLELRAGGTFHYSMRAPDGKDWWGKFVYGKVAPPEKLAFVVSFSDEQGNITRHPLSATWPREVQNTLTLEEHNGITMLTLRGAPINATEEERTTFESNFAGMQQGFNGTFGQLEEYLANNA